MSMNRIENNWMSSPALLPTYHKKVGDIMQDLEDNMSQCLSQDLESGCLKLAVIKFLGVQIFKGDHNILIFQS